MTLENQEQGQPANQANSSTAAPSDNTNVAAGSDNKQTSADANTQSGEKVYAGKYKSVDDLEKGYKESSKVVRDLSAKIKELETSAPKAPEKYEFDFSKVQGMENVSVDLESPEMKNMLPVFKELNLTQEQASRLVQAHLQNLEALMPTAESIKKDLGPNAQVMIDKLQEFTNKLPLEDQKVIAALSDTAAGIDFLYRQLIGEELQTPVNAGDSGGEAPKTSQQLMQEAFEYKKTHANSIGFDKNKQETYENMKRAALIAQDNEKKVKK